jgi:hypothetical protein
MLFIPYMIIYYPTNALDLRMAYINSFVFRHRGAILRGLLQLRCTSQPANICFFFIFINIIKREIIKICTVVKNT